jgi:hypothetical protein
MVKKRELCGSHSIVNLSGLTADARGARLDDLVQKEELIVTAFPLCISLNCRHV